MQNRPAICLCAKERFISSRKLHLASRLGPRKKIMMIREDETRSKTLKPMFSGPFFLFFFTLGIIIG